MKTSGWLGCGLSLMILWPENLAVSIVAIFRGVLDKLLTSRKQLHSTCRGISLHYRTATPHFLSVTLPSLRTSSRDKLCTIHFSHLLIQWHHACKFQWPLYTAMESNSALNTGFVSCWIKMEWFSCANACSTMADFSGWPRCQNKRTISSCLARWKACLRHGVTFHSYTERQSKSISMVVTASIDEISVWCLIYCSYRFWELE